MKVKVVQNVKQGNDRIAENNRRVFQEAGVLAVNLMSSPGSGKTTLLERTLPALGGSVVIVGDLQTARDAERLNPHALEVIQINTGLSCHLYANQISETFADLPFQGAEFAFIENVGNMVCPGEFDLGENLKVALLSIPEGDDKVAKYPTIFRAADLVLLTKSDLLPWLAFDIDRVLDDLSRLNANVSLLGISSLTGEGMDAWLEWLRRKRRSSIGRQASFVTEA